MLRSATWPWKVTARSRRPAGRGRRAAGRRRRRRGGRRGRCGAGAARWPPRAAGSSPATAVPRGPAAAARARRPGRGHRGDGGAERVEVDAQRDLVERRPGGEREVVELAAGEVGGHHHAVEAAHQGAVEDVDRGAEADPPAGAELEHRVEPLVGEQQRRDVAPARPRRDGEEGGLVRHLDGRRAELLEGIDHPPRLHDQPVAAADARRAQLDDGAVLGRRAGVARAGDDEHPLGAGGDVAGAEGSHRGLHPSGRGADEVGELGDAHAHTVEVPGERTVSWTPGSGDRGTSERAERRGSAAHPTDVVRVPFTPTGGRRYVTGPRLQPFTSRPTKSG